jgi:hypothetical protein
MVVPSPKNVHLFLNCPKILPDKTTQWATREPFSYWVFVKFVLNVYLFWKRMKIREFRKDEDKVSTNACLYISI